MVGGAEASPLTVFSGDMRAAHPGADYFRSI
jgi:hypothetical protein